MRLVIKGCWLTVMAAALFGCIVTIVGEYESYAGTATENYSATPEGALPAYEKFPNSPTKAFVFGLIKNFINDSIHMDDFLMRSTHMCKFYTFKIFS